MEDSLVVSFKGEILYNYKKSSNFFRYVYYGIFLSSILWIRRFVLFFLNLNLFFDNLMME